MMTMAAKPRGRNILRSRKGLATVEAVPLLVIFVMISGFALGLWGSIHTAILHSIAARTYAFETFANRTNLTVHRLTRSTENLTNRKKGIRFHAISSENQRASGSNSVIWTVTTRPLAVGYPSPNVRAPAATHLSKIFDLQPRNQNVDVGPIWIMVGYGMCLNSTCGGR